MEKFYIITNERKDKELCVTHEIRQYIEQNGKICILSQKDEEGHILPGSIPGDVDCAVVLGGDGTLIRAVRELEAENIPLLGVNMGTLGYLTEVELPQIKEALDALFAGKMNIEERMMMQGMVPGKASGRALNDIIVTRDGALRVIHVNVYVNGILLNSYYGDGVIISTPTGSTGYNLSAGGPVVEPTASVFVITPVCPHALNSSSIVLSAEDVIEIEICEGRYGRKEHAAVTFDGAYVVPVATKERIIIKKAEETTKLIKLSKESFMKIMRKKMKGNE